MGGLLFLHVLHIGEPKSQTQKSQTQKVKKKSKKVTTTLKSHPNSKKSKKNPFFFFFFDSFCYKNVDKMFHQLQKVIFSPKKVKKSQIFFFFFAHIVRKKVTLIYIFLNFGPLTPLKNPYYENIKIFQKIKFSSNLPKYLLIYLQLMEAPM